MQDVWPAWRLGCGAKKGRGVARCATLFTVSCLPKKTVPQVATLLVCKQKQLFQLHTIFININ